MATTSFDLSREVINNRPSSTFSPPPGNLEAREAVAGGSDPGKNLGRVMVDRVLAHRG
jgi:hypothetical protein